MTYQEALDYISSVNWKGSVPGLERITELMHKLGDPQDTLRFIHIGGTNGKGSTAAFLSHILKEAGYKTGLFISPFIEVFNERMQINNCNISDEELAEITEYIRPFADSMEDSPTEFELNTAIAFIYFSRNHCDIVVLEVGMGGEFDATNVIKKPEAAIITAIGLDHMAYLGNTVEEIAATKAGIIKPGSSVVLYRQSPEVTKVIENRCRMTGSQLYVSEPDLLEPVSDTVDGQMFHSPLGDITISLPASYQKQNLAVVLKTVEVLRQKGFDITTEQVLEGLAKTTWPGRFEILRRDPIFLVDGAHNPHGMAAAARSLKGLFGDRKLILIMGVLADKDYHLMLDYILPSVKTVLCISPDSARALPAAQLAEVIRERGIEANAFDSVQEAAAQALSQADKDDVICAIGSLYMIGDIKRSFSGGIL